MDVGVPPPPVYVPTTIVPGAALNAMKWWTERLVLTRLLVPMLKPVGIDSRDRIGRQAGRAGHLLPVGHRVLAA